MSRLIFTRTELRLHNGRNGLPAYIAFQGSVYEVSWSYHWWRGQHHIYNFAGDDLTAAMDTTPHGTDLREQFPVAGILQPDTGCL